MRPIICALLLLSLHLTPTGASAQNTIPSIVRQRETLIPYYEMASAGSKIIYLPMDYGRSSFSIQQKQAIKDLENTQIVRIDLVYSDYPAKKDFSPLTQRRLEALQNVLPGAFSDKQIEFRKIRQTDASSKDVASGFQHGFFIYFRPLPAKGSGEKEVTKLTALLGSYTDTPHPASDPAPDTISTASSTLTPGIEKFDTGLSTSCQQITLLEDTTMASLPKLPEGWNRSITKVSVNEVLESKLLPKEDEKLYRQFGDSLFCVADIWEHGCTTSDYMIYEQADTTVSNVFNRHHWGHSLIIADVTGSMYPYTAQLLKWLQLNLTDKTNRAFIFFNDGDDKPDDKKVIGSTGGIYSTITNNYDEVERTITTAMKNGSGGDAPENNIEALLEGDKLCKNCDTVVMIADNWAPIKDLSLLSRWHKPVKVVVCGVFDAINKDYLKLARDTKGSIHLIEEDIYTLSSLKEGETIKIHGVTYKLMKGEFIVVPAVRPA